MLSVAKLAPGRESYYEASVARGLDDYHAGRGEALGEQAWRAALRYLEEEACATRCGRNGAVRERGDGFVAAAFRHRTSRAQDPHCTPTSWSRT